MDKVFIEQCPVCGSEEHTSCGESTDTLVSHERFSIHRCSQCGFKWTYGFPEECRIGKYYESDDYVSHSDIRKGMFFKLYHFVRQQMLQYKSKLVRSLVEEENKKPSLVDYGCGTGYFLNTMRMNGWHVSGLEVNPSARLFADEKFGLEIHPIGYLNEIPSNSQDIITLWHVLEHVENLPYLMNHLTRILKPTGRLVIALPNNDSFDARHYQSRWAALDVPRHLWHFNKESFVKLIHNYHLELISLHKMPFDGFYISMMSEQSTHNKLSLLKGFTIGLIGWISSWFNPLQSSSIIYVIEKK